MIGTMKYKLWTECGYSNYCKKPDGTSYTNSVLHMNEYNEQQYYENNTKMWQEAEDVLDQSIKEKYIVEMGKTDAAEDVIKLFDEHCKVIDSYLEKASKCKSKNDLTKVLSELKDYEIVLLAEGESDNNFLIFNQLHELYDMKKPDYNNDFAKKINKIIEKTKDVGKSEKSKYFSKIPQLRNEIDNLLKELDSYLDRQGKGEYNLLRRCKSHGSHQIFKLYAQKVEKCLSEVESQMKVLKDKKQTDKKEQNKNSITCICGKLIGNKTNLSKCKSSLAHAQRMAAKAGEVVCEEVTPIKRGRPKKEKVVLANIVEDNVVTITDPSKPLVIKFDFDFSFVPEFDREIIKQPVEQPVEEIVSKIDDLTLKSSQIKFFAKMNRVILSLEEKFRNPWHQSDFCPYIQNLKWKRDFKKVRKEILTFDTSVLKSTIVEDKIEEKADDEDTKSEDSQLEIVITEIDTESNVETTSNEIVYLEPVVEQNEKIIIEEKREVVINPATERLIQEEYKDFKKIVNARKLPEEPIIGKYKNMVADRQIQYEFIMRYDDDFNNRINVIDSFVNFRRNLIMKYNFDETHSVYAAIEQQILNRSFEMYQKLNERYEIKSNYDAIKNSLDHLKSRVLDHPKVDELFD